MANGCTICEAKVDALDKRIEARSASRDSEITELRTQAAETATQVLANAATLEKLGDRYEALANRKQVGILQIISVAGLFATLLGGLSAFVLGQAVEPLREKTVSLAAQDQRFLDRMDHIDEQSRKFEDEDRRLQIEYASRYGNVEGRVSIMEHKVFGKE